MTWDVDRPVRRSSEQRAAYRAFIRANHPDIGGDPSAFVEGIAAFGAHEREWHARARFDAPIEIVNQPTGLRRIADLLRCWWKRRTDPPRVR